MSSNYTNFTHTPSFVHTTKLELGTTLCSNARYLVFPSLIASLTSLAKFSISMKCSLTVKVAHPITSVN